MRVTALIESVVDIFVIAACVQLFEEFFVAVSVAGLLEFFVELFVEFFFTLPVGAFLEFFVELFVKLFVTVPVTA